MKKQYMVFSNHNQPTAVKAELPGGVMVDAVVDSIEVQFVPEDGKSGTVKMVFTAPAEMAEARDAFVVGESVEFTF